MPAHKSFHKYQELEAYSNSSSMQNYNLQDKMTLIPQTNLIEELSQSVTKELTKLLSRVKHFEENNRELKEFISNCVLKLRAFGDKMDQAVKEFTAPTLTEDS